MKKKEFVRPADRMKKDRSYKGEITHAKIEQVLGKAMVDDSFRNRLFREPEKVGEELGLNESSIKVLQSIEPRSFDEFGKRLSSSLLKDAALIIFCASY